MKVPAMDSRILLYWLLMDPISFKDHFLKCQTSTIRILTNNYILSSIPLDDNVRKVINSLYFYQYGKDQNDFFKVKVRFTTPRQLIAELKTMFLNGTIYGLIISAR